MSDPFSLLQRSQFSIPDLIGLDMGLKRQNLQSLYVGEQRQELARKRAQEAASDSRASSARALIAAKARPEEVMAQDPEIGMRYADYVAKNGDAAHEAAQRQAGAIVGVGKSLKQFPPGDQRRIAAWQAAIPVLKSVGATDEIITQFNPNDDAAIDAQIAANSAILKAGEDYTLGRTRFSGNTNQPIASVPEDQKWLSVSPSEKIVPIGPHGDGGDQGGANVTDDALFDALIQQESGGRPGVEGPPTPYGRAQGMTQMLPNTAQAMAGKLNLPWQPQMMTDTSPQGADYQTSLGRAYFDEGLRKYNGDRRKALMYYHGGPDERIWGPKTRAYADAILARVGVKGGGAATQGGDPPGTIYGSEYGDPKPRYRLLEPQEAQQRGLPGNARYQESPDGQVTAVGGQERTLPLKQIPPTAVAGIQENLSALRKVIGAIRELGKYPDGVGYMKGNLPDDAVQRSDPKGVDVRAAIGEIAAVKIHDLSGAAVSASESPRFTPFIPKMSDAPATVHKKLKKFGELLAEDLRIKQEFYNEENGYRPYRQKARGGQSSGSVGGGKIKVEVTGRRVIK